MESFMKKLLFVLLVLVVLCVSGFALDFDPLSYPPPIGGGDILLDAGIGFWYTGLSPGGISIPPLFVNVEYALPVEVPLSVGGGISFFQWKVEQWHYNYTQTYITPQARANWHWGFNVSWLDLYTGLSLGYHMVILDWGVDSFGEQPSGSGLYWGIHVGAHFYFTEMLGAVVESGYPFVIKAGLAVKLGGQGSGSVRSFGNQTVSGQTAGQAAGQTTRYMLVNADSLNVRSGPSADYAVVGQLTRDTRVQVLDSSGTWWQIRSGNIEGYVNSSYLSEERR
jgi:hypothetical protein